MKKFVDEHFWKILGVLAVLVLVYGVIKSARDGRDDGGGGGGGGVESYSEVKNVSRESIVRVAREYEAMMLDLEQGIRDGIITTDREYHTWIREQQAVAHERAFKELNDTLQQRLPRVENQLKSAEARAFTRAAARGFGEIK
jgi:hypothetical protein